MPGERPSSHGEDFLKRKYDLHKSEEVEEQAALTEHKSGEQVSQKPHDRIRNYLARFEEILVRPSKADLGPDEQFAPTRERGIEALKQILKHEHVINPEDVPESYFELQKRIAREQGRGEVQIGATQRRRLVEALIADQESSMEQWIDYLASPDAIYPTWLKYWATRSILDMGEYDKEKKVFTKRSKGTVKPFPDLDREALAIVLDAVEKKAKKEKVAIPGLDDDAQAEFEKSLEGEDFAKLYAFAIEKVTPETRESLENTEGRWVKYDRGSDHMPLVKSIQGHGTGWCTAGESTAANQLADGDFHVYYSHDKSGNPTVPRVAIRMDEDGIAEVRGISPGQNLDPFIGEVVGKKMSEFLDGAAYEKKAADMKRLTAIDYKSRSGQSLEDEDLIFLYEFNSSIEGFGYGADPRIGKVRARRDQLQDLRHLLDPRNDHELALKAIAKGLSDTVVPRLDRLSGINQEEIVDLLIRKGRGALLVDFLEKFPDVNRVALAKKLIEKGFLSAVVHDLDQFSGLDGTFLATKIFESLASKSDTHLLGEFFQKMDLFPGLDRDWVAKKSLDLGVHYMVLQHLPAFPDHDSIIKRILRTDDATLFLNNLDRWHLSELDAEIATLLIEKSHEAWVAKNLERFTGIGAADIDRLVSAGHLDAETASQMKTLKKRSWFGG